MFAVQNLPLLGTKSAQVHVPQYPLSFSGRSNTAKGRVNTAKTKSKHIRREKGENNKTARKPSLQQETDDSDETVNTTRQRRNYGNGKPMTVIAPSTRYVDEETTAAGNR